MGSANLCFNRFSSSGLFASYKNNPKKKIEEKKNVQPIVCGALALTAFAFAGLAYRQGWFSSVPTRMLDPLATADEGDRLLQACKKLKFNPYNLDQINSPIYKNSVGILYQGSINDGIGCAMYSSIVYKGEFANGKRQGQGVYSFPTGDRYEGDWVADKIHGEGVYFFVDGERYEGEFADGQKQGKGVYFFANGDRYEGGWLADKRHGKGVYFFANGARKECDWVADKIHGEGVYFFVNGERYEGEFADGQKQGKGVYFFANGARKECEFANGQKQGKGILILKDGTVVRQN